uniref:Odorant receptor n=1 Tax=Hedya nubiferana TaxID=572853 RepID=A0A223HD33_9NEOP|nr:putative odorant receptor OR59 [Hedya nubiferana]
MMETKLQAQKEIRATLSLCIFCMRCIGLSFERPANSVRFLCQKLMFVVSVCTIVYHVFSEIVYIGLTLSNSPRVEDVVPLFHTFGYGALSIAKVFALWSKKEIFAEHLGELSGIWPMEPLDEDARIIKQKSVSALRLVHQWYFSMNVGGVLFYNVTPICVYLYQLWQGLDAQVGFVWMSWYPFDKHQPLNHVFVYLFEVFAGQTCVWIMIGTDLLFSGLASHIALLLRLLHKRLESLADTDKSQEENYQEIVENIKLHQRLIRYCNDLEEAFTIVNLINVVFSSLNICCVVFVIVLLEPLMAVSNKLFLGSALIQIGMLCWYADDIFHSNADVALAVYNSGWYRTDPRCRRALVFLIRRAQKPVAFTAMKFTNLSLVTYSSILTRSYSYFALLYTMYNDS